MKMLPFLQVTRKRILKLIAASNDQIEQAQTAYNMHIFSETKSFVLHFESYFILSCLGYLEIICNKELLQSVFSLEVKYA